MIAEATPQPRAYGYARVSRTFQAAGSSLDEQKDQIARYFAYALEKQGVSWGECLVDTTSARLRPMAERPAGAKIAQTLQKGDHLIISKLDRAFRNCRDALTQIELWDKLGFHIHLLDMPGQDLSSPAGRFIFSTMAAMAQFETDRRRERLLGNKAFCYAQGYAWNRCPILWKRERRADGKDHLVLNQHMRAIAQKIVEWRSAKIAFYAIVGKLKELGLRTSAGRHWTMHTAIMAYRYELWLRKVAELNGGELPDRVMPPVNPVRRVTTRVYRRRNGA